MNIIEYDKIPQAILDELVQFFGEYEPFHYGENISTLPPDERKLLVSLKPKYTQTVGELEMMYMIRGLKGTPFKLFTVIEAGYIKPNQ